MKRLPNYIQKLKIDVIAFVQDLEFENKLFVIAKLHSIAYSMCYAAPEAMGEWIEKYFDVLNKELLILPNDTKRKLQEMLKMTDEEKEDWYKIIHGDDE